MLLLFSPHGDSDSSFLLFFSVGSIFEVCVFVAIPMPFSWVTGLQDTTSLNRSMAISLVIVFIYLTWGRVLGYIKFLMRSCQSFGMLSFGLVGLIKSHYELWKFPFLLPLLYPCRGWFFLIWDQFTSIHHLQTLQ